MHPPHPERAGALPPLADANGRGHTYLRLSVTDRCNLRCAYCMPPGGFVLAGREALLAFDELERLGRIFADTGVTKIRLTGGEPLTRPGLPELVSRLAAVDGLRLLGLTTNGLLLRGLAAPLKAAGLERLNISLDTLRAERFERIAGRPGLSAVREGVAAALEAGFAPLKINMVVMEGINDDEVPDFVELTRDLPLHVRFIELMPFGPGRTAAPRGVAPGLLRRRIEERHRLCSLPPDDPSETAARFSIDNFQGTVGFISPLSEPFCGACNRLRVTADGRLKTCLFQPATLDLRRALREGADDDAVAGMIRATVAAKAAGHGGAVSGPEVKERRMHEIGG